MEMKIKDAGLQRRQVRTSGAETQGCCAEHCGTFCGNQCGSMDILCKLMAILTPAIAGGIFW